jgi:hypothetical protein
MAWPYNQPVSTTVGTRHGVSSPQAMFRIGCTANRGSNEISRGNIAEHKIPISDFSFFPIFYLNILQMFHY